MGDSLSYLDNLLSEVIYSRIANKRVAFLVQRGTR